MKQKVLYRVPWVKCEVCGKKKAVRNAPSSDGKLRCAICLLNFMIFGTDNEEIQSKV
jgi:hypothetical protein